MEVGELRQSLKKKLVIYLQLPAPHEPSILQRYGPVKECVPNIQGDPSSGLNVPKSCTGTRSQ